MSDQEDLLIIGHRGASADHPENTVEAFVGARGQGADWVELDVRIAVDGSLIVHHDAWYRDGRTVWSVPLDEVPEGVIDLATALDACDGMGVNVEIKNSPGDLGGEDVPRSFEVADLVVDLLRRRSAAGVVQPVLVSCFDLPTVDHVRAVGPGVRTGHLVFDLAADPDAVRRAAAHGHDALHPWDPYVSPELIEACHDLGLLLNTWTVDDPARLVELAGWGVDGIVTNVPGLAAAELGRT
jgi:glycerophosphoryl diester phosphodiesterase